MNGGLVFWFTGLSGAGKSTLAKSVKPVLEARGLKTLILDGDEIRERRPEPLGFTEADIKKNNDWVARHCAEQKSRYDVILVPIISPYAASRRAARETIGSGFFEVFLSAGIDCVAARDTKGLYRKAKNNEITNLIGFSESNPYEAPADPDLVLATASQTPEASSAKLVRFILGRLKAAQSGS